eukprot:538140-Amphidinium_carterae.2
MIARCRYSVGSTAKLCNTPHPSARKTGLARPDRKGDIALTTTQASVGAQIRPSATPTIVPCIITPKHMTLSWHTACHSPNDTSSCHLRQMPVFGNPCSCSFNVQMFTAD